MDNKLMLALTATLFYLGLTMGYWFPAIVGVF